MTQSQANQTAAKTYERLATYFASEVSTCGMSPKATDLSISILLMNSLKPAGNGTFILTVTPDQRKILQQMEEQGL